jgi:hypothetical protein
MTTGKIAEKFEPYWLDETDWLVFVLMADMDDEEDRAYLAEQVGYLSGYGQLTNTRILALIGDPGPRIMAYEILLSFSSPEEKQQFLNMVQENEITAYDEDEASAPTVPSADEIRDAQPLGLVLPEDVMQRAQLVAVSLMMGADDESPSN